MRGALKIILFPNIGELWLINARKQELQTRDTPTHEFVIC